MRRRPTFPSDLRALFRATAHAAVASSFAAAGCGGAKAPRYELAADAAVPWTSDWVPLKCTEDGWPLDDANLERSLDYLGSYFVDSYCDPLAPATRQEHRLYGTPCAAASDRDACLGLIQRGVEEDCEGSCPSILIATHRDEVIRYAWNELEGLLGPVDTEVEAALAAYAAGATVYCAAPGSDPDGYGTRIRATLAGFEVQTRWDMTGTQGPASARVSPKGYTLVLSRALDDGICGRSPAGLLRAAHRPARSEAGGYFSSCAHLEAASVFAFEQLARDLARLGAPAALVERSLRAALDEIEHARAMESLASRFGGECATVRVVPPGERDLLAIAIENASEGCVRETYGALLACYQTQAAQDCGVRSAMAQIAEDETRHAELSWHVASWLEPQLSDDQRAVVSAARCEAFERLRSELSPELSRGAARLVGLPDGAIASALLAQLDAALDLRV